MRTIIAFTLSLAVAAVLLVHASADPVQQNIIGPEDILSIVVTNHDELNNTVTVSGDGTITMVGVGTIMAAGKTPSELASEITTTLSKTRKLVSVAIGVKEVHSRNVRVIGAVKIPGPYELKQDWRVMDLVDMAGGLTQKPARVVARVVRGRSQIIPIDLPKADSKRDSEFNLPLMRDDLLMLDEADMGHPQVIVLGSVMKPGVYELDDQSTVLSMLTLAGGPTEKASLSTAYVIRGGKQIPLNLTDTARGKPDTVVASFKFLSGDVLFVPESLIHFTVMGSVVKPGYYPFPDTGEITALDALNLAGGSVNGNLAKAGIVRTKDGKPTEIPVNFDKMLNKGDTTSNITLQANDLLFIPPSKVHNFAWSNLLLPLTALSLLGLHF